MDLVQIAKSFLRDFSSLRIVSGIKFSSALADPTCSTRLAEHFLEESGNKSRH